MSLPDQVISREIVLAPIAPRENLNLGGLVAPSGDSVPVHWARSLGGLLTGLES